MKLKIFIIVHDVLMNLGKGGGFPFSSTPSPLNNTFPCKTQAQQDTIYCTPKLQVYFSGQLCVLWYTYNAMYNWFVAVGKMRVRQVDIKTCHTFSIYSKWMISCWSDQKNASTANSGEYGVLFVIQWAQKIELSRDGPQSHPIATFHVY